MGDIEKLGEMVNSYPTTISNIDKQIASLNPVISDLNDQKTAIENLVLAPLKDDSDIYLSQKAIELTGVGACNPVSCTVCTYGGYGVSNLTDWIIVSAGAVCPNPVSVWSPGDLDPLGTVEESEQYQRQLDFAEAYGHITDAIGTNGTYGLNANISNLTTGKTILENNKAKYEHILSLYSQYT